MNGEKRRVSIKRLRFALGILFSLTFVPLTQHVTPLIISEAFAQRGECQEPGKECLIIDASGCSRTCEFSERCVKETATCVFGFGSDASCKCEPFTPPPRDPCHLSCLDALARFTGTHAEEVRRILTTCEISAIQENRPSGECFVDKCVQEQIKGTERDTLQQISAFCTDQDAKDCHDFSSVQEMVAWFTRNTGSLTAALNRSVFTPITPPVIDVERQENQQCEVSPLPSCEDATPTSSCTVNDVPNRPCVGTNGNDRILGTHGDDVIFGAEGQDRINGLSGNDLICGGEGNDILRGNLGWDRIFGGPDSDTLRGGTSADQLFGEGGDDRLFGDKGDDALDGGADSDWCQGGENGPAGDSAAGCETVIAVP